MTGNACFSWARGDAALSRPRDDFAAANRLTNSVLVAARGPRRGRPARSVLPTALLLASVAFLASSVLSAHAGGGVGGGDGVAGGAGGANSPTGAGGAGHPGS